jgi:endonuclease/exonuclease/phosphatase family metal-dependent hydrolase
MKYKILLLLFFALSFISCAQTKNDTLFVAHWNVENLFDTINDSLTIDEEFLPNGKKEWTQDRLDKKIYNLSRIIRSMNDNNGPDFLGVCEVEHQSVLDTMLHSYFSDKNYKVAYLESPDGRGIDNGIIYNQDKLSLLKINSYRVNLSDRYNTRLILEGVFLTQKNDTIYFFVNHWPSRRGGEEKSEPNRIQAAKTLRSAVESILAKNLYSNIIIVGDFNDEPGNIAITEYLKAQPFICDSIVESDLSEDKSSDLFNLAYQSWSNGSGSFFYRDDFNMLDQIIVSKNLLVGNRINYICNSFEVYKPEIMVTHTGKFKGAPFPTYGGARYLGGYSDHFPVIAKFKIN